MRPSLALSADRRYLLLAAGVPGIGVGGLELRVLDLKTNTATALSRGTELDYIGEGVCWSPDGLHVGFFGKCSNETPEGTDPVTRKSLYVMSVADRTAVEVAPLPGDGPVWRMKYLGSERLVYERDVGDDCCKTEIGIVNLKTGKVERTLKRDIYTFIWPAADGKTLVLDDQGP
jgi:hypothetical protein